MVAPYADVISRREEAVQPVFERGEGGEKTVALGGGGYFPDADLAVLVGGEDFGGGEGDGLDGAGSGVVCAEGVDLEEGG